MVENMDCFGRPRFYKYVKPFFAFLDAGSFEALRDMCAKYKGYKGMLVLPNGCEVVRLASYIHDNWGEVKAVNVYREMASAFFHNGSYISIVTVEGDYGRSGFNGILHNVTRNDVWHQLQRMLSPYYCEAEEIETPIYESEELNQFINRFTVTDGKEGIYG